MKRFMLFFVVLLYVSLIGLSPVLVSAADITLSWEGHPLATGYRIEQTLDPMVATPVWTTVLDNIPQPNPFPVDRNVTAQVTIPDTGLVLLRAVSFNATEEAVRTEAGAWYNFAWTSQTPTALGVK